MPNRYRMILYIDTIYIEILYIDTQYIINIYLDVKFFLFLSGNEKRHHYLFIWVI